MPNTQYRIKKKFHIKIAPGMVGKVCFAVGAMVMILIALYVAIWH